MKQRRVHLETPKGPFVIASYVGPEELSGYGVDPGIGVFASYRSILVGKEGLAPVAGNPEANLTLALFEDKTISAYAIRRPPLPGDRWAKMNPPVLHEIIAETARGKRDLGLVVEMMKLIIGEPESEDRILFIVGYSWTWDLDETHKTLNQYRDTIIHLLEPWEFKQYPTNEPNVSLRPENLFMARIGANLDRPVKRNFTNLLFGIQDDD